LKRVAQEACFMKKDKRRM